MDFKPDRLFFKTIATLSIPDEKTESFSSLLTFHRTLLMDKIHALRVFNNMSSNMVENYLSLQKQKFRNTVDDTLSVVEKKKYDIDLSLALLGNPKHVSKNSKIAKLFEKEKEVYNHREHIRRASKEMVLVYLVIIFEEFLSSLLSALFVKRHDTLKASDKSVSFKDALEHTDINDLVKTMSKKESKGIVDMDIEDLGKRLGDRFHLYLDKRKDWPKFKEFFYRRHIIVHNYGFPDTKYIEKTKFKGEKNHWIEISDTYLNEAFNIFENYANEMVNFFHKKYAH